jgi:hypothetical protein
MALPTASDNVFPKLILSEGAAPAAPAAGQVKMYAKADGLLYWKDDAGTEYPVGGSGMTNPMTTQGDSIYGGASGTPTRLPIGTAGQVWTVNAGATAPEWAAAGAGGSGATWTQLINETGASFANWTAVGGTWASNGTLIQKTNAVTAAHQQAYYSAAKIPFGFAVIAEAEIRLPTTGQGTGVHVQASIQIGSNGTGGTGNGVGTLIQEGTDTGGNGVALDGVAGETVNKKWLTAIALDTWYKLRTVINGPWASVYLDGVLLGTTVVVNVNAVTAGTTGDYFALNTYNCVADYRNIKVWVLSGEAPA